MGELLLHSLHYALVFLLLDIISDKII